MAGHQTLPIGPPSAAASGALTDLLETVAALWPDADVSLSRRDGSATRLVALPSDERPRMLVPESRRPAARALQRFSAALGPAQTATRAWGALACRLLGPGRLGGSIISITGGQDSILQHLGRRLGRLQAVSITIGDARVNRKPVLQLFDDEGHSLGYAKVGLNADTARAVEHEADALRTFDGSAPGIALPRVIDLGHWNGHPVLLMTALPTRPTWQREHRAPLAAMAAFSLSLGHEVAALRDIAQWRRVRSATSGEQTLGLAELTDSIESMARTAPEPVVGCWHGDWTPWNMGRGVGGRLSLWDLERFERGAVHGIDAFHFFVNAATRRRGESPEVIGEGMRAAWRAAGGGHQQWLVGAVYLAVISERYLSSAASSPLGRLIDTRLRACVAALRIWLDEVRPERS